MNCVCFVLNCVNLLSVCGICVVHFLSCLHFVVLAALCADVDHMDIYICVCGHVCVRVWLGWEDKGRGADTSF